MSQAAVKGRNHPKQVRVRGPDDDADDRRTPRALFDRLDDRFHFTLDAAASVDNALCSTFYTLQTDGLERSWRSEMVWCNPPYSMIPEWIEKGFLEMRMGCVGIVYLLPADRTEQPWWQDHLEPFRERDGTGVSTEFIRGRVKFGLPPDHPDAQKGLAGGKDGGYRYPPFPSVLVILGAGAEKLPPRPRCMRQARLL